MKEAAAGAQELASREPFRRTLCVNGVVRFDEFVPKPWLGITINRRVDPEMVSDLPSTKE